MTEKTDVSAEELWEVLDTSLKVMREIAEVVLTPDSPTSELEEDTELTDKDIILLAVVLKDYILREPRMNKEAYYKILDKLESLIGDV